VLVLPALTRGAKEWEIALPSLSSSIRLGLTVQGFQRIAPLFVPLLVQPIGHRPLEAVDLGFQSGVPRDLPLPPQPVLQAYFILNTSG
jgi:hypothetical protein